MRKKRPILHVFTVFSSWDYFPNLNEYFFELNSFWIIFEFFELNNFLNEYFWFNFELNIESNHFLAQFNVKMNNQNVSATPNLGPQQIPVFVLCTISKNPIGFICFGRQNVNRFKKWFWIYRIIHEQFCVCLATKKPSHQTAFPTNSRPTSTFVIVWFELDAIIIGSDLMMLDVACL